jgi:methionyl-tRNA synthetase
VFIRTTDKKHEANVQNVFDQLLKDKKIYKGKYEGYYCSSCESYYTESQAVDGKCPDCKKEVYKLKQDSYFLKVAEEKEFLTKLLNRKGFLLPKTRINELMSSFVDNDLKDLSLTRNNFK